jgi:Ca2+-binding EF-hand superfamily protein
MKADKNSDGSLTLKEIEKILPEMNIDIKKSHIRQLFDVSVKVMLNFRKPSL